MKEMKKKLKMRCKRSFALLLALAMCLGTTPGMAFASEGDGAATESSSDSGSSDTGSSDSGSSDTGSSDSGSSDTGSSDSGSSDSGSSDSGSSDAGSSDSGNSDSGSSDSSSSDTGSSDSVSSDSGSSDSGSSDAGSSDSVSSDAGSSDNGSSDTGVSDGGSGDTGASDGSSDSSESGDTVNDGSGQGTSDVEAAEDSNAGNGNNADVNATDAVAPGADVDTDNVGDASLAEDADADESNDPNGDDSTPRTDAVTDANGAGSEEITVEIVNADALLDSYGSAPDQSSGDDMRASMFVDGAGTDDAADAIDDQIMTLEDAVPVEEAETVSPDEKKAWDITQTERPGASEDVEHDKGTADDKLHIQDKDWDIFYDAEKDVYKITFNIKGDADAKEQTIDLTQALELLGQYAASGKQELEDAINKVEKPVKEDAGKAPEMGEIGVEEPTEPLKPVAPDAPSKPEEPEKPVEPGKPEDLDKKLEGAYDKFAGDIKYDTEAGEPMTSPEDAVKYAVEVLGMDKDDPYTAEYGKYLYDKAYVDWVETNWDQWNDSGYWLASYFGDKATLLAYGCGVKIEFEGGLNGTPILDEPEYKVDKNSQAYKDYIKACEDYESKYADYETELKAYKDAQDEWLEKYGEDSPQYKQYLAEMDQYEKDLAVFNEAKAKAEAAYEAAVTAYNAKKAEIEKKFADDKAAYDAAIAKLEKQYESWAEANVLQPGDIRKFELYLTSDSKHTYKYQSGSFTLATPELKAFYEQLGIKTDGLVVGFDGQELGGTDVRPVDATVSFMSKPMLDLFRKAGIKESEVGAWLKSHDFRDVLEGWYDSTTDEQEEALHELLGIEKNFSDEDLRTAVEKWIIGYYSTDGKTYKDLADLVANNPQARAELSSTTGNTAAMIGGSTMSETLGAGFNYNNFYQSLFGFAFGDDKNGVVGITDENGDPISMTDFLGKATLNQETGLWEYGNKSWTNNGYQMALYYYMDHQEIWEKTDTYFKSLLNGGLSAEQATWTSLMMAVNIDGVLTGNGWQDTKWPWYSSIKLDRMDIDFNLTKKDGETNETITNSETEFQVYYIDKVTDKDGKTNDVKMYCTYDPNTSSYTFVTTPSTVWTDKGELNISYAMMKDIVYYLQEMTAPEGYERDTNVYIVMSEEDYNKLSDEDKASLEGTFNKFLNMTIADGGLTVNTDFVNVKIVTTDPEPEPENPPSEPDRPTTSIRRHRDPSTSIPNEPTPLADIPDAAVPLASIPDEDVPLTVLLDEDVPLASVPKTGDISSMWYALLALSGIGLLGMAALSGKKSKESASN